MDYLETACATDTLQGTLALLAHWLPTKVDADYLHSTLLLQTYPDMIGDKLPYLADISLVSDGAKDHELRLLALPGTRPRLQASGSPAPFTSCGRRGAPRR